MSNSSPDDLAVAFRSFTRRLHEAQGDAPAETTASATAECHSQLAAAGRLLGTSADPESIADAISNRPADEWDEPTLDALRTIALDLGRLVRHVASLTEG